MHFTLTFPGSLSDLDVAAMLIALKGRGFGVSDPDSWTGPEESEDGNWHINAWKHVEVPA